MKRLTSKMGWEIADEEWPDFRGRIYGNRPRTLPEMLDDTAAARPGDLGFLCGDRRMTFGEFQAAANRVAAGFQHRGVRKGDRVALLLGIGLEFALCFFGAQKLGAIAVPLNTRFKDEELGYEINDSGSKILVVDEEYWPHVASARAALKTVEAIFFNGPEVPSGTVPLLALLEEDASGLHRPPVAETDDAVILYTSGTTGKPKGAILHHRGLIATAMHVADFLTLKPGDKFICCVPLFHVTGLAMLMLASVFSAVPCVYTRTFKAKEFLEVMARERVTKYIGVINILWLMINHPDFDQYDLTAFNGAMLGGSAATEEMVHGIRAKLPHLGLSVGYGLTEGHGIDTATPFGDVLRKIRGVGKPLPLVEVRVAGADGKEVAVGGEGEILLRGPMVMKGYWKKPEATKAAIEPDGWLHTGDIGKVDEEGFVYVLDRIKDMINRGGEKVFSLEVENVLMSYPDVLEVSVVGVPDSVMGEAVKAVLVLLPGASATAEDIQGFCRDRLADYKVPKYVEFRQALPRNPAGKVLKAELRAFPEKGT